MPSKRVIRIADSLAYRVHRSARLLRKHFLDLGRSGGLDLTPEQWFVLNKLIHEDGQRQVDLGESIFADRPNMTRMLASMEDKGLVAREGDGQDARSLRVKLTPAGRRTHDAFASLVPDARRDLFKGISDEELEVVERVLDRLERNILES